MELKANLYLWIGIIEVKEPASICTWLVMFLHMCFYILFILMQFKMSFIIYKLYLNQYWKPSKFHSHWKSAGQGTLTCRHLQILNLWTGDCWAWWGPSTWGGAMSKALPLQPYHLETCTTLLFFRLAHPFRSKHRQGEKNLRSIVFFQFSPSLGTSWPFRGTAFPKCLQSLLSHYFQEGPGTMLHA